MPSLVKLYLECTKKSCGGRIVSGVGDLEAKRWVAFHSHKVLTSPFPPLCSSHLRLDCEASLSRNKLCPGFGIYLVTSLTGKRKSILFMVGSKGRSFSYSDSRKYVFPSFFPPGVIHFHFFLICHL